MVHYESSHLVFQIKLVFDGNCNQQKLVCRITISIKIANLSPRLTVSFCDLHAHQNYCAMAIHKI